MITCCFETPEVGGHWVVSGSFLTPVDGVMRVISLVKLLPGMSRVGIGFS